METPSIISGELTHPEAFEQNHPQAVPPPQEIEERVSPVALAPAPAGAETLSLNIEKPKEIDSPSVDTPADDLPSVAAPIPVSNGITTVPPTSLPEAASSPSASAALSSFYSNLDLDLEPQPVSASDVTPTATPTTPTPSTPTTPTTATHSEAIGISTESNVTPSTTNRFGAKKVRVNPGSNISRRITMLAAGKNENNSDEHTIEHTRASSSPGPSGRESPDPSDYPDSMFEELLRQDQTTVSRSFSTLPRSTPRPALLSKNSMPTRLPSSFKNSNGNGSIATANANRGVDDEVPPSPAFVSSGDVQEDLKRLEAELVKTKEVKSKAESDAKAQRVTVMSLKTELQLVRNVLKRRETELGDVKDMSGAYESELAELRQKLVEAERQLSRGQEEKDAKIRALERLKDESVARIQTLDQNIKNLRQQLEENQKKNLEYEEKIQGLEGELEELAPYRETASAQRELTETEPAKVKELNEQITSLEDTRDMQAALIEELESKISTVEAEALEFKGKAELEYEALSDGFKVLKNRRSEEIMVLKAELEQHKLQEQIIEKLQADIDRLTSALASVADSQSTENARINQVTAELNEALAQKDQEVVQVRQNMTEFEESHNRLVSSLQATLATIYEEADAARKSRDEAVVALESLREELEALRHSLPINSKHMSLSQWSAEQQQSQQEQLQAIRDLEEKLDGQVEGVKGEQQRAGILEANTKRRSQQLTLDMEYHLQLSNAIVQKSASASPSAAPTTPAEIDSDKPAKQSDDTPQVPAAEPLTKGIDSSSEPGIVSVRTMLKFLSQLQGRPSHLSDTTSHIRDSTETTVMGDNDYDYDYESQLHAYLLNLNDVSLNEPWAKEKELEGEISKLEHRIQSLLSDLSLANQKTTEAQDALKSAQAKHEAELQEERDQRDELERLERLEREEIEQKVQEERRIREDEILKQQQSLESKEEELTLKETSLREKEKVLLTKEQEMQKRVDAFPVTPPLTAPATPFGSPNNSDLLPGLLAAHFGKKGDDEDEADLAGAEEKRQQEALEREKQAEMAAQQIKLIKSLEEKIAELEKRGPLPSTPTVDEHQAFPSPPISVRPRSSTALSRNGSQTLRSSLLNNPPDTPPPTIALPPIPTSPEYNGDSSSPRSSSPAQDDALSPRKKSSLAHTVSSESLVSRTANAAAATEAAVAAAVAKQQEAQKELALKLEQAEAELTKTRSKNQELETELVKKEQTNKQQGGPSVEFEMQKLKQENTELAQVLEEIRKSLDQAQNQVRGLEDLKSQLETQVQKEKQLKDDAIRTQDRLQTQLEAAMQKKKGFLCF